ncbi:MAG: hypothetical protein ABIS10_11025 [Novosphingobium sp.]
MPNLTPLEAHVFAYYLANSAKDFSMVGRWFPYAELQRTFTDKMQVDVRPFGQAAKDAAPAAAKHYFDHMLANGGFATKEQKFGGTMHQHDAAGFKTALEALKATDPVLAAASAGGADYWATTFAELTN